MKIKFSFILFLGVSFCTYSQVDSSYIKAYSEKMSFNVFSSRDFISMSKENNADEEMTYMSNNPANIGLGFSINNTVLSFAYGYGFDFLRDKSRGKTESVDFQLHNYGRRFVFDIFFQKYKGFYLEDDDGSRVKELCPDLKISKYGVEGQYIFNHKRYSYKAAFDQNEKQIKSAGTILFGGGVYSSEISSDSSFIYRGKTSFSNFQFGLSGGYAYTWVINPKWYIAASSTIGINFGSDKINTLGKQRIGVYPSFFPRFAAGYNHNGWSLGLFSVTNVLFPAFSENRSISILSGTIQLRFTQRFDSLVLFSKK